MGCHTWFYVPIDVTFDEAQKVVIKYLEKQCFRWGEGKESLKDAIEVYGWTKEHLNNTLLEFQDLLALAKSGNKDTVVIWFNQKKGASYSTVTHRWYKRHKGYHNLFRVFDYPGNELFSMQDCVDFISSRINTGNGELSKRLNGYVDWDKLRKFWKDNPQGRITFG